jgi:hypothetical protein
MILIFISKFNIRGLFRERIYRELLGPPVHLKKFSLHFHIKLHYMIFHIQSSMVDVLPSLEKKQKAEKKKTGQWNHFFIVKRIMSN